MSAITSYESCPIKRKRRTSGQLDELLGAIKKILLHEEDKITIRHLYYRLVGEHLIPKTEQGYKNLGSHLTKWRRSKDIPWDVFADNTRWHIHRKTFDSLSDALENTVTNYRRNMWENQEHYVEVWVEKDSIAAIVAGVANDFGVPVFVGRGFASMTSLFDAANVFRNAAEMGKKPIVYHLGDYDPSGVAIAESVIKAFRDDFDVDVELIRAAVTPEQIRGMDLPTRPVKTTDGRSKGWKGECVELDTMPAAEIKKLVEDCITQHIDPHQWKILRETEKMEKETLRQIWRAHG